MKFEITPKMKQVAKTISYLVIELVLLSFYANTKNIDTTVQQLEHYRGLSAAGSVFMMLSFLVIIVLHFKYFQNLVYFLLVFMPFAVFLILIGMGLASTYFEDFYNFPVAYWFIQVMLLLLGLLVLHKLKVTNTEEPQKQQNKGNNYAVPPAQNV